MLEEDSRDLIHRIHEISQIKTENGKKVIDTTIYQGIAMWWFMHGRLYYDILAIIKNGKSANKLSYLKSKLLRYIGPLYLKIVSFLIKLITIIYPQKTSDHEKNRIKIIETAFPTNWREIRELETKRIKKGDALFELIISRLKQNAGYDVTTIYPAAYPILHGLKTLIEKRRSQKDIIHKTFEIYWTKNVWKKEREAGKYFRKIWSKLKEDKNFKESWVYNETDLYETLKKRFEYYYTSYFPMIVSYIELAKQMIEIEKPSLILLMNEYSGFIRALLTASKLKGIPTLAIQHGVMGPQHPGYMYIKDEISPKGSVKASYCPIPHKIAVYGPHYKYFLTKVSAFPEDSVVITGQPRYDVLAMADKMYDRREFCKKHDLNPNKKIVLLATQPFPIVEHREIFLKNCLEALKSLDVQIVIKPHPCEDEKWHRSIIRGLNGNVSILPRTYDTFEAIYSCDLFMAVNSTTIIEALILDKAVVSVNLAKISNLLPWVEDKAALGVYDKEDLLLSIKKALYDDETRKKLKIGRAKFVYDHCYKSDGKATERVVDLIKEMVKIKH